MPVPRETVIAALAADDPDGDGGLETTLDEVTETLPSRKQKRLSSLSKLVGRALESIDAGRDARVHALVGSIERKLRKHADTVPGLDHEDFVDSVRGALRLAIDQTDCAGGSARCTRTLARARSALVEGDRFQAQSDDRRAVLRWRRGLQALERIE
ncbi:MAG: hypothetical protein ABFS46_18715 [Myxococcota bacterium]